MRTDLAKVITESYRGGSNITGEKTGRTLSKDEYELDDHGPLRMRRRHDKSFTDLLGPLRRCLRKQVGRPWDTIYSELSRSLDKRSVSGLHIWDHIKQEVELHGVIEGGMVYHSPRYSLSWRQVEGLYVHPRTGLLCWAPQKRWRYRAPKDPNLIALDKVRDSLRELQRIDGIWYLIEAREVTDYHEVKRRSRKFDPTSEVVTIRVPYARLERTRKKQLNAKELRSRGLTNGSVPSNSRLTPERVV